MVDSTAASIAARHTTRAEIVGGENGERRGWLGGWMVGWAPRASAVGNVKESSGVVRESIKRGKRERGERG